MISFKISDIPVGSSSHRIEFSAEDIALEEFPFSEGVVFIDFERDHTSVKVDFLVEGVVQLICDRSLDSFDYPISREYAVLYRENHTEDEEDEELALRKLDLNRNQLSLSEEIRQTILLEIPIKKLHPRFLDENGDPTNFDFSTNSGEEDSNGTPDNRWDVLKKLRQQDN